MVKLLVSLVIIALVLTVYWQLHTYTRKQIIEDTNKIIVKSEFIQEIEQTLNKTEQLIDRTEEYAEISKITGWSMDLAKHFIIETEVWKIDRYKALAVCQLESNYDFNKINYNNNGTRDIGVFQINDVTYLPIVQVLKANGKQFDSWDRTDPYFGITAGIYWLSHLQNTYDYNSTHELLTAYNRGHGGMLKLTARSGSAVSAYSIRVNKIYNLLKEKNNNEHN